MTPGHASSIRSAILDSRQSRRVKAIGLGRAVEKATQGERHGIPRQHPRQARARFRGHRSHTRATTGRHARASGPDTDRAAPPTPIAVVDVVAQLEKLAAAYPQKLNWRVSIADLLRLLGIDNSLAARKEMARELGCPEELIGGDYSRMNMWLHKTVLARIAANGGNVPKELLD